MRNRLLGRKRKDPNGKLRQRRATALKQHRDGIDVETLGTTSTPYRSISYALNALSEDEKQQNVKAFIGGVLRVSSASASCPINRRREQADSVMVANNYVGQDALHLLGWRPASVCASAHLATLLVFDDADEVVGDLISWRSAAVDISNDLISTLLRGPDTIASPLKRDNMRAALLYTLNSELDAGLGGVDEALC
ncbi:hypothetical protein CPLU01_02623 [Colletotrichum plurivorum]|uniref:Uncharacterized protein n=1 Tax=Colletotrichum plurivorum TaxID=2175906 RepID=A0A8H6NLP9_9PEZI|nr:hypothetical protein CPLU01_02623 [Colletotrichum plurivorum]